MDPAGLLHAWDSYYVIIGSSAAALTGLMFVVMTLLPESRRRSGAADVAVSAFSTPTVVHLCAALLVSAGLSAPWDRLWKAGLLVSLAGGAGVVYSAMVFSRMRRHTRYTPVFEDWLCHAALPFMAYATLIGSGASLAGRPAGALFAVAGAVLLLLFVGIHNAWDTVTFLTLERFEAAQKAIDAAGTGDAQSRHRRSKPAK